MGPKKETRIGVRKSTRHGKRFYWGARSSTWEDFEGVPAMTRGEDWESPKNSARKHATLLKKVSLYSYGRKKHIKLNQNGGVRELGEGRGGVFR